MSLKLGKIKLKNKGILAPMLEYTNLSFRQLCAKNNCALAYTEMIHTSYILNSPIDEIKNKTKDEDYPVSLQLVGDFTNTKETIDAFTKVQDIEDYDIIDFNLGCPSPKIAAGKGGAILLKDISKVSKTLKEIKEISNKPITAKIRLGYDKDNSKDILNKLELSGIDALAIHGRLGVSDYSIPSDYKKVISLAKETSLPIIYNGDITLETSDSFKGIDEFSGLMVGRDAVRNPSIFSKIAGIKQKTIQENISLFLKISKKYNNSIINQKLVLLQMLAGFSGARQLRAKLTTLKTQKELDLFLEKHKIDN